MREKHPKLPPVTMMTAVDKNGNPISNPEIERLRLRLMSLFGIASPAEIEEFMQSPAGVEAVNIVAEEIMLQETYHQQYEQDLRDARIRRNRLLGFLLLAFLYKKAHAEERIQEAYEEYKKMIEHGDQKAIKEAKQFSTESDNLYQGAEKALSDYLDTLNHEAEKLEKERETLGKEQKVFEQKYQVIDKQVNKGLDVIKGLPHQQDPAASTKKIKQEIFKLDNKIEALSNEIAKMAENDENISDKLHQLNGYAVRREMLESFLNKDFYTIDGERIKPEDKQARYHEAVFFLKPGLKLVKHDGQLMILRHDQDPKNLSVEKLDQAAKTFAAQQNQYSEISKLCAKQKADEQLSLSTSMQNVANRCERLNSRMMLVTSQISALQKDMEQAKQISQAQQAQLSPILSTIPTPKPKPAQVTQSYRHMLLLMGAKSPDPAQLLTIAEGLAKSKTTDKQLISLLLKRLEQSGIVEHKKNKGKGRGKDSLHEQLRSGGQIQPQTLRELQQRINQRPSTVNPIQKQHESLTPFSMTPIPKPNK